MRKPQSEIEASYDRVADDYADEFFGELERKSFDREVLDRFAESVREGEGRVCEIGCGPGHIARYFHDHGVGVCCMGRFVEVNRCCLVLMTECTVAVEHRVC